MKLLKSRETREISESKSENDETSDLLVLSHLPMATSDLPSNITHLIQRILHGFYVCGALEDSIIQKQLCDNIIIN